VLAPAVLEHAPILAQTDDGNKNAYRDSEALVSVLGGSLLFCASRGCQPSSNSPFKFGIFRCGYYELD
jgi:hypothetical protein